MNVFVRNAKYIGDFKFDIEFNIGKKIVDIKKVGKLDKRYREFKIFQSLENEEFVKRLKPDGITLSNGDIDIALGLLYKAAVN